MNQLNDDSVTNIVLLLLLLLLLAKTADDLDERTKVQRVANGRCDSFFVSVLL